MYLRPALRLICGLSAFVFLLILLGGGAALFSSRTKDSSDLVAVTILFVLVGLPTGFATLQLLRYLLSEARRKVPQLDVLRDSLGFEAVAERGGVQWAMVPFPDTTLAPGVVVIAVLLQNAHGRPRRVTLNVRKAPCPVSPSSFRFDLAGGEAGVFRIPAALPAGLSAGTHAFMIEVRAEPISGVGWRVLRRDGASPRAALHFRQAMVEVEGSGPGPSLNAPALASSGFRRIYVTGQAAPDLEPLRPLEALVGRPS